MRLCLIWIVIAVLLIGQVQGAERLRAQTGCGASHCGFLPLIVRAAPLSLLRSELRYHMVGVIPVGDIYAVFANTAAAPLCDVAIDYTIHNLSQPAQSGTRSIPVIMPDEEEWLYLAGSQSSQYTIEALVRSWRAEDCAYVRLTPVDQTLTVIDFATIEVTGTIRNNSGQPVHGLRVRLFPGHNLSHHYDLALPDVTLAPDEATTYAVRMQEWYLTQAINEFRISAIGAVE